MYICICIFITSNIPVFVSEAKLFYGLKFTQKDVREEKERKLVFKGEHGLLHSGKSTEKDMCSKESTGLMNKTMPSTLDMERSLFRYLTKRMKSA